MLVFFFSCEKPVTGFINCSQCRSYEPVKAVLKIKLGADIQTATVNIYEGNLEDGILYESFITSSDNATREVPLNKKYTLTAVYSLDAEYIVVNSVSPRVIYDEDSCDEPCYYIYDNVVNLRLKYTR